MDDTRPILPAELEFFNKGTGKGKPIGVFLLSTLDWWVNTISIVPLVVVFTKFDGQMIQEYGKLDNIVDDEVKWNRARKNAENSFQRVYLPKIFNTEHPPKAYVQLEGEHGKHSLFQKEPMHFNRNGYTRAQLSGIDWEDCQCHWWYQFTRTVCLNTNEQSWPLCWIWT